MKICCLNLMVTTAANISIKMVFHKIALFIILSHFLCKRSTNGEQPCEGLASRSLQIEIRWLLFQWGERQLPKLLEQTAREESSKWETSVPGVKGFRPVSWAIPGSIPDKFSTLLRGFSAAGCGGAISLAWVGGSVWGSFGSCFGTEVSGRCPSAAARAAHKGRQWGNFWFRFHFLYQFT